MSLPVNMQSSPQFFFKAYCRRVTRDLDTFHHLAHKHGWDIVTRSHKTAVRVIISLSDLPIPVLIIGGAAEYGVIATEMQHME